jgi:hypothetical protein
MKVKYIRSKVGKVKKIDFSSFKDLEKWFLKNIHLKKKSKVIGKSILIWYS